MHSPSELRPGWLSAILFALIVALYCFVMGVGVTYSMLPAHIYRPGEQFDYGAYQAYQERVALRIGLGCAVASAIMAVWGWRAPRPKRFHIAYLSGVALLSVTLLYVWSGYDYLLYHVWGPGQWHEGLEFQLMPVPTIALVTTTTGLVLILTAFNLDRR